MNQVATTAQPTLPGLIDSAATDQIRREVMAGREAAGDYLLRRALTVVERNQLAKRASALDEAMAGIEPLQKAEWAKAKQVIGYTLGGFSVFQNDPDGTADIFRSHCRGVPLWAISRGCEDFVHNRVLVPDGRGGRKPLSIDHPITSARLREAATRHIEPLQRERIQIKMIMSATKIEPPVPDAAAKARIGDGMRELARTMAERALDQRAREGAEPSRAQRDADTRDRSIMAEYRAAGVEEPVRAGDGSMISLPLAVRLGWSVGNLAGKRVMLAPTRRADNADDQDR